MLFSEILINMIIISIPEEILMAFIALLLMGRYDYIDKYQFKENLRKIMLIVVIPCVVLFSYGIYGLQLNFYIRIIANSIIFYVLLMILLRSREWFKIALFSMISMFIVVIIELSIGLIVMYGFNVNTSLLNVNPWINFLVLLPVRLVQFSIVYIFYIKKNAIVSVSVLSVWGENLAYRKLVFLCISTDIIIGSYMYNEFTLRKSIESLPINTQTFIVISLFILLILNLLIPWIAVLTTYPVGKYKINRGG